MKIVFMGTPAFAVASLKRLLEDGHEVAAVVTVADKPAGRGQQIQMSEVKKFAMEKGLRVLQPLKLKDEEFYNELKKLDASLFVVVAFRMLPEKIWSLPTKGSINLHASLLPKYRGAAPINHAIIQGEKESGVSSFFLKHEIDTGNILFQTKVPIEYEDDAGSLHDKLMVAGAELLSQTVRAIEQNTYHEIPQPEGNSQPLAPKIFKEDCRINFNQDVESIRNFIRGLSPYPAAICKVDERQLKIYKVEAVRENHLRTVGSWEIDKQQFKIFGKDGYIKVLELQEEGKKRLRVQEWLNGYKAKNIQ